MERNWLMTEINDSVSRVIDNMGFSAVTREAHTKLVEILITRMASTVKTLKIFIENSNIPASSISMNDMLTVLKYENVNIQELSDYMQQVLPFPPLEETVKDDEVEGIEEEHENILVEVDQQKSMENVRKVEEDKEKRQKLIDSIHTIPRFDDMDEIQLGFSYYKPVVQPLVTQLIPARPMKRPALSPRKNETNVKIPRQSQSTPDIRSIAKTSASYEFTDFAVPSPINTSRSYAKTVKKPRGSYTTRKKYLKKHESRLRQEQIEEQERMKQEKIEKEERSKQKFIETRREDFKKKRESARVALRKKAVECETSENGRITMKIRPNLIEKKIPKLNIRFRKLTDDTILIKDVWTEGGRVKHADVISTVVPRNNHQNLV